MPNSNQVATGLGVGHASRGFEVDADRHGFHVLETKYSLIAVTQQESWWPVRLCLVLHIGIL
jgi:hypothetical protein